MAARPRRRRSEGRPIEGFPNAKAVRLRRPYLQFYSALEMLNHHFDNWLLPREPEESAMTRVVLAVQNILEYETELAIAVVASRSSKPQDRRFQRKIEEGYVSFKSKFEWLRKSELISNADEKVMDAIRKIRNEHIHWRPSPARRKLKYFGTPLLTRRALTQMLLDVQRIVVKLRGISGSKETLAVIPRPSFFDELDRVGQPDRP